jgi:hypothetical protein
MKTKGIYRPYLLQLVFTLIVFFFKRQRHHDFFNKQEKAS